MLRFTVFAALLTTICAIPIDNIGDSETTGDVIVVTSIDEYLAQNPSARILAELQRDETEFNELRYTIGNRVNGDRVVSTATYRNNFGAPSNVASTVRYPANGVGSIVSYVSIVANQNNNDGRAYTTSGGVNQRQITFVVEAKNVLHFSYKAEIFGYN